MLSAFLWFVCMLLDGVAISICHADVSYFVKLTTFHMWLHCGVGYGGVVNLRAAPSGGCGNRLEQLKAESILTY